MLLLIMSFKSLKETNPYLIDPETREQGLLTTVSSSTAIEGIQVARSKIVEKTGKTLTRPHKASKSGKSPR
jgi:hypothetical protein